jgi:hypothetical protein
MAEEKRSANGEPGLRQKLNPMGVLLAGGMTPTEFG